MNSIFCKLVPESYFPNHQPILLFKFDLFTHAIKNSLIIKFNQLMAAEFAWLYVTRTVLLMGGLYHATTPHFNKKKATSF